MIFYEPQLQKNNRLKKAIHFRESKGGFKGGCEWRSQEGLGKHRKGSCKTVTTFIKNNFNKILEYNLTVLNILTVELGF